MWIEKRGKYDKLLLKLIGILNTWDPYHLTLSISKSLSDL